jgi:hypothetical protein
LALLSLYFSAVTISIRQQYEQAMKISSVITAESSGDRAHKSRSARHAMEDVLNAASTSFTVYVSPESATEINQALTRRL